MQLEELNRWREQAELEADKRQQDVLSIQQLQRTMKEIQDQNKSLEIDVRRWKLLAEQYQSRVSQHERSIKKALAFLGEAQLEFDN